LKDTKETKLKSVLGKQAEVNLQLTKDFAKAKLDWSPDSDCPLLLSSSI